MNTRLKVRACNGQQNQPVWGIGQAHQQTWKQQGKVAQEDATCTRFHSWIMS